MMPPLKQRQKIFSAKFSGIDFSQVIQSKMDEIFIFPLTIRHTAVISFQTN